MKLQSPSKGITRIPFHFLCRIQKNMWLRNPETSNEVVGESEVLVLYQ